VAIRQRDASVTRSVTVMGGTDLRNHRFVPHSRPATINTSRTRAQSGTGLVIIAFSQQLVCLAATTWQPATLAINVQIHNAGANYGHQSPMGFRHDR
jgi:hypothetical protein